MPGRDERLQRAIRNSAAMEVRYRQRIAAQVATINRLLEGATYDEAMEALHKENAELRAQLEERK